MTSIRRRSFLQAATAASALSAAGASFGPAPAYAGTPGKLGDIDHIIILMKENRSFDHYFGMLSGVRGFDDNSPNFRQPDPLSQQGYVLPFRLDTLHTNAQRQHHLSHKWKVQHNALNGGAMNNWVPAHRMSNGAAGPLTMGYLTRADLPFYYALADAFTLCDGYFCSVLGPTHPNRFYLMTASIDADGRYGKPAINNKGRAYTWETYPERLERAGISWCVYHETDDFGCNVLAYFTQYRQAPQNSPLYEKAMRARSMGQLLSDLKTGNIPQVTWIIPRSDVNEHPEHLPAAGEDHTNQILTALWSNPALWAKTAVILNYDENDGIFDHVLPPIAPPGTASEYTHGLPVGLGFRVPCMVISPYSRGHYVNSHTFDHTSTLRLIEARFGVEVANLSRWRRETCGDLTSAFDFGAGARLDIPKLPETAYALRMAEERAMSLPPPQVPVDQAMPRQESGARQRLA
ncbi:MAG: alkaline phosphatase family protein [Rhizomicrobium sp.]